MSDYLKRYRLPSFVLTAREPTDDERTASGECGKRDVITIEIRRKGEKTSLVVPVGSPVIMVQGKIWNEDSAARSALSFASAPSCWDDQTDREWSRENGERLTNEAFCHRILGKEMRQE